MLEEEFKDVDESDDFSSLPFRVTGERKNYPSATDVVVIRPPEAVSESEIQGLASILSQRGFISILLPREESRYDRWYPTDSFREVGQWLFESGGSELEEILQYARNLLPQSELESIRSHSVRVPTEFTGGNYVHFDPSKLFVYAEDQMIGPNPKYSNDFLKRMRKRDEAEIKQVLGMMKKNGWQLVPVRTRGFKLPGKTTVNDEDLDFLLSLFQGKDNKPHAIVASSFVGRTPRKFSTHQIPDSEALRGGCNIADLRQGKVLVIPNRLDAPTTHRILSQFAHPSINIIETPANFLDGGGGPRCSISAFRRA
ncbi:hypothetical protein HY612_04375 [Candidatus Roizmanbacteria bacterium]|nr:hypothetical protein [Candidatus Roizmanbacteria bacterium]